MTPENSPENRPIIFNNNELTSQEFQQMLYSWFETKDIISDLRKYLRVKVIEHLRYLPLNNNENHIQNIDQYPLKQQAFNLLIGEYLLNNGYLHTLSVFSIEAPAIINQLPIVLFEIDKNKDRLWKFDCVTVGNIIELIGIPNETSDYDKIREMYSKNPNKSLLYCVISNKFKDYRKFDNNIENNENLSDYFSKFLSNFGIPKDIIVNFNRNVQQHMFRDIERINKYHQKRYDELVKNMSKKDDELKRIIQENAQLKNEQILLRQEIRNSETRKIEKICEQEHCREICRINIEKIKQLHNEIDNLHEINNRKLLQIEKLSMTINLLQKDLNASQIKINFLNNCLQQATNLDANQFENDSPESRLKSPNSDTADGILQQIRYRLQDLEQESDVIEAQFKLLKI